MVARSDCFRCGDGASPITITTRRPPSKPSALRRRHSSAPVMATRTPIGVKSREIRFQRTHPGAERVGRGAATANELANSLAVLIRSPRHLLDRHSCAGKSLASWRSRNPSYWRHSAFLIALGLAAQPPHHCPPDACITDGSVRPHQQQASASAKSRPQCYRRTPAF